MKQKVIQTIASATNAAELILGGITELGAAVPLKYNLQPDINEELVNTIMACGNYDQAKKDRAPRRGALTDAIREGQKFARATRDMLKMVFGNDYSEDFNVIGFVGGSLAVPDEPEEVKRILQAIKSYLTNNPTQEVGTAITATRAEALRGAIVTAQQALAVQEGSIESLMNIRDEKGDILRKRVSSVYQELRMQLGPLDPRWLTFGFNMPGADERPEMPGHLQVALIGPTAAAMKWEAAARASFYHVWKKVLGVDDEPVMVGSPADLDFTIENFPTGVTIEIYVSAVNNGGESPLTQKVTVNTHA